jgi:hypothetical protein
MGLGIPDSSVKGVKPIYQSLWEQNLIDSRSFSFFFTKKSFSKGSKLVLGGVNYNYADSEFRYFKIKS